MTATNRYPLAQWSLAACALAAAAALVTLSPRAPAATFTYTNPSCSSFVITGTPPTQTVTCVSAAVGSPVCTPTATPAAPAIGQQTTISADCTNQPTAYAWTGGACTGLTTATCKVGKSRASTVTYGVSATNGSGTGAVAQIAVTWQ